MTSTALPLVTFTEVAFVDNEGQPCEGCQTEGNDVTCTVYGVRDGERVVLDRCLECAGRDAVWMDQVTVEISAAAEDDVDAVSDRMHSQDCTCVHPDAR